MEVFDVNRPDRTDRRRRGKSDLLDAQNAARSVLRGRTRAQAKSGNGPVQMARMYKLAKVSAVKARTQAINQLKAVLVIADPSLREKLAGLGNAELFRTCARLADDSRDEDVDGGETVLQATRMTLCWPGASGSSPSRSRTWKAVRPGSRSVTPRSCRPWWVSSGPVPQRVQALLLPEPAAPRGGVRCAGVISLAGTLVVAALAALAPAYGLHESRPRSRPTPMF
ncbi:hypothetical protein [Streptomyces acidicola]|uniref:hypothetical protein n=1 Tax=Streptomyces acidicola TaxID=2596892 RepID=UPI001883539C|nr:hypothetical protein [Streptomyces acidicola]